MTENNMMELNLEQMDQITGGTGGSPKQLPKKKGYRRYRIVKGDRLGDIARRFGTTAEEIQAANPNTIHNVNDITAGYYIYIPRK